MMKQNVALAETLVVIKLKSRKKGLSWLQLGTIVQNVDGSKHDTISSRDSW